MVERAKPGLSKPPWVVDVSSGRKGALINFYQLRTTASKASIQKQIIVDAFCTAPRKPVVDALWAALSRTPVVQRRLSPLFLRRVSSFEVCCEGTETFPEHINHKDFYLPIHEKKTLRLGEPLCLDEDRAMFWHHALRDNRIIIEVGPVFLAGIGNASLLNDGTIIRTYDNILLCDPEYYPQVVNGGFGRRPATVIPRVDLKLSGEYLHLGTVWSGNYYHWMLDVLPRLLFAERFDRLRAMPMIVQRGITQTQRESLRILGIPPDRIIEFNGHHWQVEQLYYIQPGLTLNPTPLHVQWLRERFALHSLTRSTRRLYISREDSTSRRVINERDLVKELGLYGFEVVTLRGRSFADQVQLFSEAEIIVGPHGAGFTNAVFAQPGASLIELFSPSWMNGCFWALANACGHRYGFMIGTQHGEDIEADIRKFRRLLTSMNLDAIRVSDVRGRTAPPS
jgi:hypothetical protein